MTPLQLHIRGWSDCRRCSLSEGRQRVVFARGNGVPAEVLMVGEAPGESEDSLGQPFVGPAGHLLDSIIEEAFFEKSVTYAITNLVGCIPRLPDEFGNITRCGKADVPDDEYIKACQPKLQEFIDLCKPRLIIAVGKLSEAYLDQSMPKKHVRVPVGCRVTEIVHPAWILRQSQAQQGLAVRRCIVILSQALEEVRGGA